MLAEHKAAAYGEPWKKKIEKLQNGDKVFLYQSGIAYNYTKLPQGSQSYTVICRLHRFISARIITETAIVRKMRFVKNCLCFSLEKML